MADNLLQHAAALHVHNATALLRHHQKPKPVNWLAEQGIEKFIERRTQGFRYQIGGNYLSNQIYLEKHPDLLPPDSKYKQELEAFTANMLAAMEHAELNKLYQRLHYQNELASQLSAVEKHENDLKALEKEQASESSEQKQTGDKKDGVIQQAERAAETARIQTAITVAATALYEFEKQHYIEPEAKLAIKASTENVASVASQIFDLYTAATTAVMAKSQALFDGVFSIAKQLPGADLWARLLGKRQMPKAFSLEDGGLSRSIVQFLTGTQSAAIAQGNDAFFRQLGDDLTGCIAPFETLCQGYQFDDLEDIPENAHAIAQAREGLKILLVSDLAYRFKDFEQRYNDATTDTERQQVIKEAQALLTEDAFKDLAKKLEPAALEYGAVNHEFCQDCEQKIQQTKDRKSVV